MGGGPKSPKRSLKGPKLQYSSVPKVQAAATEPKPLMLKYSSRQNGSILQGEDLTNSGNSLDCLGFGHRM